MNEIRLKRIYADNKLKRFRTKKNESASIKLIHNQKMVDEIAENSEETKKMINVIDEKIIKTENNENIEIENVIAYNNDIFTDIFDLFQKFDKR